MNRSPCGQTLPFCLTLPFPFSLAAFRTTDSPRRVLCPVCVLRSCVDVTAKWRTTDQLFVRFGACPKGTNLSKQRLVHWVSEAAGGAYRAAGKPMRCNFLGRIERGLYRRYLLRGNLVFGVHFLMFLQTECGLAPTCFFCCATQCGVVCRLFCACALC